MDSLDALLILLITAPMMLFAAGWLFMLFIGNASIASAGLIPALGYWPSVWVVLALKLATATVSTTKS